MSMPIIETERLLIRSFTLADLETVYQLLDLELGEADLGYDHSKALDEREKWLRWTVINEAELAKLYQPPYGDRAVCLKQTGQLIGACGYVPSFGPFEQLPSAQASTASSDLSHNTPEFGLYYAFSPAFQGQGYATEAAQGLIEFAFAQLKLKRIVATTTYENTASIRVMEKLGMRIERNPYPEPSWFQVVGILDNKLSV